MAVMGEISAGIAHELNNPFGVIVGYLKLLEKNCSGGQMLEDIKIIREEIHLCKDLVKGLLELSRPQKLKLETFDLVKLIQDTIDRLVLSENSNVRFSLKSKKDPVIVSLDELAIKRLINNVSLTHWCSCFVLMMSG